TQNVAKAIRRIPVPTSLSTLRYTPPTMLRRVASLPIVYQSGAARRGMSDPIVPVTHNNVQSAIKRAADSTGVDFTLLVQTAQRESSLNPNARAGTSSATGLFQFVDGTWLDMVRRHGAEHGLANYASALQSGHVDAATRHDILALRSDPELSARMAGEL